MTPPPDAYDQRPMLWTTGGILGGVGLLLAIVDHPLVPLSYVFHLLPIGIGGAIGAAILREKYGPRWIAAYAVLMIWLTFSTITSNTTIAPVFLAGGTFPLVRAILQTATEMGG